MAPVDRSASISSTNGGLLQLPELRGTGAMAKQSHRVKLPQGKKEPEPTLAITTNSKKLAQSGPPFAHTRCGLVVVDESLKPLYFNSEVICILDAEPKSLADSIQARLRRITTGIDLRLSYVGEFRSGRRVYLYRTFPLDVPAEAMRSQQKAASVFVLERSHFTRADLEFISRIFRLTSREQVALAFLASGLTDKEIAERMSVSPNTVKAFLRTLMAKMGVSTRTGLMRKLLDHGYVAVRTNLVEGSDSLATLQFDK